MDETAGNLESVERVATGLESNLSFGSEEVEVDAGEGSAVLLVPKVKGIV